MKVINELLNQFSIEIKPLILKANKESELIIDSIKNKYKELIKTELIKEYGKE